jgi:3-methyladenine DNA glycosylase/8-oxoguanine DNA glycosylase
MITQQHARDALAWARDRKLWALARFVQPYATGAQPMPPVPAARSTFAWYVAGVIGQRVRFGEAQARRRRLYLLAGTSDITRDHLLRIGGPAAIAETIGAEAEVGRRLWTLASEPDDARRPGCRGVGAWTTKNVELMESITGAGRPIPLHVTGDKMLQRRIAQRGLPPPEQWGPHTGVFTWLLWR